MAKKNCFGTDKPNRLCRLCPKAYIGTARVRVVCSKFACVPNNFNRHGGVMVSTGMLQYGKRVVVGRHFKSSILNLNANKNLAYAA